MHTHTHIEIDKDVCIGAGQCALAAPGVFLDLALAYVDHGFDGEGHAGHELFERPGPAVVQHLRQARHARRAQALHDVHHRTHDQRWQALD